MQHRTIHFVTIGNYPIYFYSFCSCIQYILSIQMSCFRKKINKDALYYHVQRCHGCCI